MSNLYNLRGYAALFNVRGDVRENSILPYYVKPGAFQIGAASIPLLFAHDRQLQYATTGRGNLHLWQDSRGLAFEAWLPMTDRHAGLVSGIRDGRYDQVSAEYCNEQSTRASIDGERVMIVERAGLGEISICPQGACSDTGVWLGNVPQDDLPPRMRALAHDWVAGWAKGNPSAQARAVSNRRASR